MSFDDDRVVTGVSVVNVVYRQPVAAASDANVVLGSVLQVKTIFEPLSPGVGLGDLTLEHGWFTKTGNLYVCQRPCELYRLHCTQRTQALRR